MTVILTPLSQVPSSLMCPLHPAGGPQTQTTKVSHMIFSNHTAILAPPPVHWAQGNSMWLQHDENSDLDFQIWLHGWMTSLSLQLLQISVWRFAQFENGACHILATTGSGLQRLHPAPFFPHPTAPLIYLHPLLWQWHRDWRYVMSTTTSPCCSLSVYMPSVLILLTAEHISNIQSADFLLTHDCL